MATPRCGWPPAPGRSCNRSLFRDLETRVLLGSSYPGHQLERDGPENHTRSPNIEPGAHSWPTKPALEHPEQGLNPSSAFSHHVTGKPMVHSLGFLICEMGTEQNACDPVACAVPATQKAPTKTEPWNACCGHTRCSGSTHELTAGVSTPQLPSAIIMIPFHRTGN